MKIRSFIFSLVVVSILAMPACKKKGCTDSTASNYDAKAKKDDGSCEFNGISRSEMLTEIAAEIIIPRYAELNTTVEELYSAAVAFTANVNLNNLAELRAKHKITWKKWQQCSVFEFGPAEDIVLRANTNTFPTDTAAIETNIGSGSYNLLLFTQTQRKGFPALDYLLNSMEDTASLNAFLNNENRRDYLENVVVDLKSNISLVNTEWDNYSATFIEADGTDVSSSLSLLVNQFNYDYELLKNAKVGIPLGIQTLGDPNPELCEAYYGGFSQELAYERLESLYNLYKGIVNEGDNIQSFDEYLRSRKNSALADDISQQFSDAINALNDAPDPLSTAVVSQPSLVDAAYEELKKMVILIKTNMVTEMEVSITYNDGDGD